MTVGAIVLAAGASRRLGCAKQLVMYRGQPLLSHALRAVRGTACASTCVVLGARALELVPLVTSEGAEPVHNPRWESGMASSIRCGVAWADREGHDAVLLCVCDQPHVATAHLDALIRVHQVDRDVVAS